MKYLCIKSPTEIEPEAFSLMGASTKRDDDSKIGCFGTGAKYAISVILKHGLKLIIYSGDRKISFETEKKTFRDKEFNQIIMVNGYKRVPLSFTTEMGLQWELNDALREIVSNAHDEGQQDITPQVINGASSEPGITSIFIEFSPDVQKFYQDFNKLFAFNRAPLEQGDNWAIYSKVDDAARVYRKGVVVYQNHLIKSYFDYEISDVAVKEDRKADRYEVNRKLISVLNKLSAESKEKILMHLEYKDKEKCIEECYEVGYSLDKSWIEVVGKRLIISELDSFAFHNELARHKYLVLPNYWITGLLNIGCLGIESILSTKKLRKYQDYLPKKHEVGMFNKALSFLGKCGLEIDPGIVEFFNLEKDEESGILGEYLPKEDKIVINAACFNMGLRELTNTLLEEYTHRKSGAPDKTREFQEALKNIILDLAMQLTNDYI